MAGGESRRMGREKSQITFQGETLLQRIAGVALDCSKNVWIVGREKPASWTLNAVRFVLDDEPALGPVGGLATALRVANGPAIAVACDMPRLDQAAIHWLMQRTAESAAEHGVVTRQDGHLEPLFACYRPAVAHLIEAQVTTRPLAMRQLIDGGDFDIIDVPEDLARCLLNVNRPEDFATLLS